MTLPTGCLIPPPDRGQGSQHVHKHRGQDVRVQRVLHVVHDHPAAESALQPRESGEGNNENTPERNDPDLDWPPERQKPLVRTPTSFIRCRKGSMPDPLPRPPAKQTTVVDFTVTQKGLEEQLLGGVIQKEQKSLEEQLKNVLEEVTRSTCSGFFLVASSCCYCSCTRAWDTPRRGGLA